MKIHGCTRIVTNGNVRGNVQYPKSRQFQFVHRSRVSYPVACDPLVRDITNAVAVFPWSSRIHCSINHQFRADSSRSISTRARNTLDRDTLSDARYPMVVFRWTNIVYVFRIGERECGVYYSREAFRFSSVKVIYRRWMEGLVAEIRAICTILTETIVAAGRQVFWRVGVMWTAPSFASPKRLDFRSQSQTSPKELLIGNATVLVRAQFPHQFLYRILEV